MDIRRAPDWELSATRKALETLGGFLNTPEDDLKLLEIKQEQKARRQVRKTK